MAGCVCGGGVHGRGVHGRGHAWKGACMVGACMAGVCMAAGRAAFVARGETTAVGGMHPTGKHSCFKNSFDFTKMR